MRKYRVPVEWVSLGYIEVNAFDLEDLKKILNNKDFLDEEPLPTDWDYLEGSFKVSDYALEDEDEDVFELIYDEDDDGYIPF